MTVTPVSSGELLGAAALGSMFIKPALCAQHCAFILSSLFRYFSHFIHETEAPER